MHVARYPDLQSPLVGASGAVSGVLGAFLVRHFHTRVRFVYGWGRGWRGSFATPAWWLVPLWFLQELGAGILWDSVRPDGGGPVAHRAHVGGFAFGSGVALGMRGLRIEARSLRPAVASGRIVAADLGAGTAARAPRADLATVDLLVAPEDDPALGCDETDPAAKPRV